MSDDAAGWLAFIAIAGGLYWASSHYEIKRKADAPVAVPSLVSAPYKPPRPSGMVEISETKSGTVLRLNADSVRGNRKSRQGWVVEDAAKDNSVKNWRYRHALYLIDCDTTAIRQLASLYYDAQGKTAFPSENVNPKDAKPEYYPQGTIGYAPVEAMCTAAYD